MNFGFNSNVRVGDALYHVQTEDRGPSHPFLDTVVYMSGRVIYKRSTSYEKFAAGIEAKDLAQKLHERLAQQHRDVISKLEAGDLPQRGNEKAHPHAENAEVRDRLHLRLLNPKNWLMAGHVILEIELCETPSQRPVERAEVQAYLEQQGQRIPCAQYGTDAKGCATLKFSMPSNVADGASLVVRATDGSRFRELRFRLKSKSGEKTPAPVS